MPRADQQGASRSLAIYGLLLNLYPQEYLRHHRAEMLQNFEDFEQTSSSKTELWLFLGKDLAICFGARFIKSLWGQTTIVAIVLVLLLAIARRHPGQHEHSIWDFCFGYMLGWFSGFWRRGRRTRFNNPSPRYFKSFLVETVIICIVLVTMLIVERTFLGIHEHSIWVLCYGYIIAWPAGWLGKRWQSRP